MPTKWQKRKLPISRCYMCVTVKFFSLFCVSAYFKTEKPDLDEQRKNRKMKRRMDFLWKWKKKRKTLLCFLPHKTSPFQLQWKKWSLECYPLSHPPNAHAPHSSHLDRLCMKGSWNKDRSLSSFDILVTILCQLIIIHLHFIIFMLHCFLKNAF